MIHPFPERNDMKHLRGLAARMLAAGTLALGTTAIGAAVTAAPAHAFQVPPSPGDGGDSFQVPPSPSSDVLTIINYRTGDFEIVGQNWWGCNGQSGSWGITTNLLFVTTAPCA
jgi:hypothetical protein